MESAAVTRSLNGTLHSLSHAQRFLRKPTPIPIFMDLTKRCSSFKVPLECRRLTIPNSCTKVSLFSSTKAATTASSLTSDGALQGLSPAKDVQKSTFPNGFEALVLEVCDKTAVAELKLKVGEFEMHLKRDIGSQAAPTSVAPTATPSQVPNKPKVESDPSTPQATPQKTIPASNSPFAKVSSAKGSKLAVLEATGSNTYMLVSSPTVGLFRSGRTLKGKKQPPSCKEGDIIKEGQIVGFLDQFGTELPIKSDVAGEVLKVLYKDGEPVGYGDPLVAVLPSFHGIK